MLFWAGSGVVVLVIFGLFLGPIFWTGIGLLGIAAVLVGLTTLGYHSVLWLLEGTWAGWSFGEVAEAAGLNNLVHGIDGRDGIVGSILRSPFAFGLIGAGLIVWWIGAEARAAGLRREHEARKRRSP